MTKPTEQLIKENWDKKWRETFASLYAPDFSWQKLEQRPYELLYLMEKFIGLMATELIEEKEQAVAEAIEQTRKDDLKRIEELMFWGPEGEINVDSRCE